MFDFIANIFGYALNFIYNIVNNYGLAVVIFTIILKLIMMPFNIKQQKTMKKSQKISLQVKEIQEKYASDPVRANQEVMDLYKKENMSPFSGCISSIVTLLIFISIFYLVSRPLTYMKHVDSEKIAKYTETLVNTDNEETAENTENDENIEKAEATEETASEEKTPQEESKEEASDENSEDSSNDQNKKRRNYIEIAIIKEFGKEDEEVNLNMNFLGLNLSDIPVENLQNPTVYIIPVLYVLTSLVSMKLTRDMTKKLKEEQEKNKPLNKETKEKLEEEKEESTDLVKKEDDEQELAMDEMSKSMTYMMPIMSVSISMIAPLGLALYWFVSNVFSIIERVITNKLVKDSEEE